MILNIIVVIIIVAVIIGTIAMIGDFLRPHDTHRYFGPYERCIKRGLDAFLATGALIVFLPVLLILTILGIFQMKGNPFFIQERPGWNEKIFLLIKFRSMNFAKDRNGTLLPDDQRITGYGRFIRNSSLDELPELINIIKGDMAIVGPRPLLVEYLNRYNEEQHHRHDVRPGLTGYAQAHGRNSISWEEKFVMDVWYTKNVTFLNDVRIIMDTIKAVLSHKGISSETSATMELFIGTPEGKKDTP